MVWQSNQLNPTMNTITNFNALTLRTKLYLISGLSSAIIHYKLPAVLVNHRKTLLCGAAVIGLGVAFYRTLESIDDRATIQALLNSGHDGLATDALEEGGAPLPPDNFVPCDGNEEVKAPEPKLTITFGTVPCPVSEEVNGVAPASTLPAVAQGFVETNRSPVVVDLHRKVVASRSLQYMNCVIAECKVKFGVPANTSANRKAVERFAGNIMKKHGVRPTHIRTYLPLVTKMVFVPDQWQIEAERLAGTRSAWRAVMDYLAYNASSVVPKEEHA
jgi:hypothetical protein